jgi:hypothetical protein
MVWRKGLFLPGAAQGFVSLETEYEGFRKRIAKCIKLFVVLLSDVLHVKYNSFI